MKTYYKKQETIQGFFYNGQSDPTKIFPENAPLTYNNKAKSWYYNEELLKPGFYYPDGWGHFKWMPPQQFATLYSDKPYKVEE